MTETVKSFEHWLNKHIYKRGIYRLAVQVIRRKIQVDKTSRVSVMFRKEAMKRQVKK